MWHCLGHFYHLRHINPCLCQHDIGYKFQDLLDPACPHGRDWIHRDAPRRKLAVETIHCLGNRDQSRASGHEPSPVRPSQQSAPAAR